MSNPSPEELDELRGLIAKAKQLAFEKFPDPNGPLFMTQMVISSLNDMQEQIEAGTFPRHYVYLPVVLENSGRGADSPLYQALMEINRWYCRHYKEPDASILRREHLISYLVRTEGISRERALEVLSGIARNSVTYRMLVEKVYGKEPDSNRKYEELMRSIEPTLTDWK